jgi:hypothetical protein
MAQNFKIKGKQVAVETLFHALKDEQTLSGDPGVSISSIDSVTSTSSLRKPLGLEPLVYFVVAYSAHLAAEVTHDMIKKWLEDRAKQSPNKISIEEENDPGDDKIDTADKK